MEQSLESPWKGLEKSSKSPWIYFLPKCSHPERRLTHKVVAHQPWIRRRSGKVYQLQTDVL